MTFQTSFSEVPVDQLPHASNELIVPLGDALGAQAHLSMMEWILAKLGHARRVDEAQLGKGILSGRGPMRHQTPTSRALTLAEAEQMVREAGVEGRVKVFEGEREDALKLEIEREQTKQRYEQIVAHADQGWGTQLLIGATGVAVDFADPVNLGTMAIPGVGVERAVYGLTKATAKLAPAVSKIIVRAGTGAYEGAVSTALAEPLNYALHQSVGDDYGWDDSLKSVATNAIGGAALHALGGLGLDLFRGTRLRPEAGAEGTIRVLGGGAEQLGSLEPVNVAALLSNEPAVLSRTTSLPAAQTSIGKDAGLGYARDAILVMPAAGASGSRVTFHDLATFNAMRREFEPLQQIGTDGAAGASAVNIYRIKRGDDTLVFTQSPTANGGPTTFTVERLHAHDAAAAGPLSNRRSAADVSGTGAEADPLLYIHPPKALVERLSETLETSVTELERLTPEELYRRFRPSEMAGNTVYTHTGNDMHRTFKAYAQSSKEIHVLEKKNGAVPDAEIKDTDLLADLKRDSPSGRQSGREAERKYWIRLRRHTVITLYDVKLHGDRIDALNDRVRKAWDQFQPAWREELAVKRMAASKKAAVPNKPRSTSKRRKIS
jgi:hypothetical protein